MSLYFQHFFSLNRLTHVIISKLRSYGLRGVGNKKKK